MYPRLALAAAVVIAALVPPLLVVTSLRVVTNDWIVAFEYAYGGVPDDRYGLTKEQRTELAETGLDSIVPGGLGVELLRRARLPDGSPAFNTREVAHMQDVRDAVGNAFAFMLAGLVVVAFLAGALLAKFDTRWLLPRALRWGSVATLAIAALAGVGMVAAWNGFFERFHGVFFEGDTWRFPSTDTLIRLYPDEFWMGVAAWIAGLSVLGAVLLLAGTTLVLRRRPA